MKLTLDAEETLALIVEALKGTVGFENISDVQINLGGEFIPLSLVQGLVLSVAR